MSNETKVNRNESFDSLSCDFLIDELEHTRLGTDSPTPKVSDFRKKELAGELVEPLLAADSNRFVLFPIKHHDVSTILLRIIHYYSDLGFEN
jgi:hypothetical protein